jgi:hypothetical protein
MLKLQNVVLIIAFLVTLAGCQKKVDTGPKITSLKLSLSKNRIVGDNTDFAKVSVVNQDGLSMMQYITVYFHGEMISSDRIVSATPSVSSVYAMYNNVKSNEESLEVVEDKDLKFEKNILLEQYTGTWCGWCPRAINQISTIQKTDKKIIHAALHLSDEMTYGLNMSLFQSFGFTGIPTVHADRDIVWNGDASSISRLHLPSRIGISLEVTGDKALISANVKVKFGYDFTENIKLSVYLLHDSLIANQVNYYNTDSSSPYYMHRNVMKKSGTDMFGDLIPAASIDIGSVYSRKIEFTNFECNDIKKMIVIAFATYGSGTNMEKVANSVKARVGEKLEFVYDGGQ